METLNSIGFCNFYRVTPAYNILKNEVSDVSTDNKTEINILLSNTNDIRHILKTLSNTFEKRSTLSIEASSLSINFYQYETFKENLARTILFMHIIHDLAVSIRDRVEVLMEVYGNTLLSSRTAEYISNLYIE